MNHHRYVSTNERLGRLERMVFGVHRKLDSLIRAANIEFQMEIEQMADFKALADEVTKIKGTVASTKAFIQGLKAKIEELAAGMNDGPDQAAVVALAAELGSTEADLANAIAANSGGSVAGNTEPA